MRMTWWRSGRGDGAGTFDLARDATVRVRPGRRGVTLRVERGSLHVTQAGDPDDHVLAAGEALWLPRGGLVVACALTPARAVVTAVEVERPRRLAAGAVAARRDLPRRAAVS